MTYHSQTQLARGAHLKTWIFSVLPARPPKEGCYIRYLPKWKPPKPNPPMYTGPRHGPSTPRGRCNRTLRAKRGHAGGGGNSPNGGRLSGGVYCTTLCARAAKWSTVLAANPAYLPRGHGRGAVNKNVDPPCSLVRRAPGVRTWWRGHDNGVPKCTTSTRTCTFKPPAPG